ncbi:transcriptional regulator with XRE-family HTH domain [Actinoplanes octamycinicus]|uniref:Transcriptional regulator with XRE-family HTH domain n=1 Tax=Actinoplanes octamycinicus TaxID=135948 RepID=A0A7W7GX58_9ACTN|nr:helix-turn-helix transcriptional regulator [Actinoplanes octamycinicus]MBB4739955.1 transcriptional regulator with XRE-family HTH domain [Actinoplanes octamycinicus]GIE55140.1 transcriptional regulator [Actinoplanes octamycinicus]
MSAVGQLLRTWRDERRLSQLDLSGRAGVSARHLSFVETGRSRPTREMILRLAEELDVPLRRRNELLLAGGFAPAYPESDLDGQPLAVVLAGLRQVLAGHGPFPAVLVDRHWTMVDANEAIGRFTRDCAPELLEPPVNVLRLALHPDGLAPRTENLAEWRTHLLHRLDRQAAATADPVLRELRTELGGYPGGEVAGPPTGVVVPLRYDGLNFFSVTSVLGTPRDVTLSELAIEAFLPADAATAAALNG